MLLLLVPIFRAAFYCFCKFINFLLVVIELADVQLFGDNILGYLITANVFSSKRKNFVGTSCFYSHNTDFE